jgi:mannan endo-1,4-beta-mannosidase
VKNHLLILFVLTFSLGSCSLDDEPAFVRVDGMHFSLNDRPYYFTGTNFWYGTYLGAPGNSGDLERLTRELDALQKLGITNLRILGGSEASYIGGMLHPAMQSSPGVYDDNLLRGLDVLLAEMAKREMQAVIFFTNYWEWSGGMSQYVTWARNLEKGPDPDDPEFDWATFMDYSAEFYGDSIAQSYFRSHIERIVLRTNTVTGMPYTEDPTIMAWELANEPRPGTVSPAGEKNLPAYYAWIDETASFIKSVFIRAHASDHIDYLTFHVWPYNWKWFDPHDIGGTIDSTEIKAIAYLHQHLAIGRSLDKPLVLEEFGLARDGAGFDPTTMTTARDRYFRTLLGMIADSARSGSPIAGTNFWAWSGEAVGRNTDGKWIAGDPLLGDPPHEPQGINSVFETDSSTLKILKEHAAVMAGLRAGTFATR